MVAVALRDDDAEDKLVVATAGPPASAEELWRKISFQEAFFESRPVLHEP